MEVQVKKPKLSIITINLNNYHGLYKTIESVLSQTFINFEYIIIDGGSSDGSAEYISDNKQYFTFCISEPDKGIYNAMNKGISMAKGEYLLFLNSGDVLYDNFSIENSLVELHHHDLICFNLIFRGDEDILSDYPNSIGYSYLWKSSIGHPSTFIKMKMFDRIKFDENLKIVSDWKFFLISILKYKATYKKVNHILTIFSANGISSDIRNQLLIQEEREQVLREYFGFFYIFFQKLEILKNAISKFKMDYLKTCRIK